MSNPPSILIVTILAAALALLVWVGVGRADEGGRKEQIAGISERVEDVEKWFCPDEYAGGMWWNEGTLGKSRPDLEEAVEELQQSHKRLLDYLELQEKTIPTQKEKKVLERKEGSLVGSAYIHKELSRHPPSDPNWPNGDELKDDFGPVVLPDISSANEVYLGPIESVTLTQDGTLEVVRRVEPSITYSGGVVQYSKDIYTCGPCGIELVKTIEGRVIPPRTIPEAVEWPEKGGNR